MLKEVRIAALAGFAALAFSATTASANPFALFAPILQPQFQQPQFQQPVAPAPQAVAPQTDEDAVDTPARLRRQIVNYATHEAAGTIIVDTPNTYLYYVLGDGRAIRYGIGVGREGFTWSGVKTVERKAEWPDWTPPPEMLKRQPYLPRFMAGGPTNPLGARAMYLSGTVYRIHGTNAPSTIGGRVSSGCIRMVNADVIDLYSRVRVGAKVVVLPMTAHTAEHRPTLAPTQVSVRLNPATRGVY